MYCKVDNGVATEYTDSQLRADNPNTSFPSELIDGLRASYSMYPVTQTAQPEYDEAYQATTYTIEGSGIDWTQTWAVVDAGVSDGALKGSRYAENAEYADGLIAACKLTPEQGKALSTREAEKADRKRFNRGNTNKLTKVSDADDYLLDYIDTVCDAQDQADDVVEDADRATLESYDPATAVVWPAWIPYAP